MSSSNEYLIIPIDKDLGNRDDFNLKKALEEVAKANGYKKGKKYLMKEKGCSGNMVKNMTRTKISIRTYGWDLNVYITKDAYRNIRKLDKKYADVINLIASEYDELLRKSRKEELLEYTKKFNAAPSYQTAFCYKSIDGLKAVVSDPTTAKRVNKIEDAQDKAKNMLNALLNEKEVIIQP